MVLNLKSHPLVSYFIKEILMRLVHKKVVISINSLQWVIICFLCIQEFYVISVSLYDSPQLV